MQLFLKAPARVRSFKRLAPGIPLPPEPIVTRWTTWLRAALYYAEHLDMVVNVLQFLDEEGDDSPALEKAITVLKKAEIRVHLAQIAGHFPLLAENLTKLEADGLSLSASFNYLNAVHAMLTDTSFTAVHSALEKLESVLSKNPGLDMMRKINAALQGVDITVELNFSPK